MRTLLVTAACLLFVGTLGHTTADEQGPERAALYFDKQKKTASAGAAVDRSGGHHVVYVDSVPYAEHPAVTYQYCSGSERACGDPASWSSVRLSDQVDEVQLALTPMGHPRVLIQTWRAEDDSKVYVYGACDGGCTQVRNWTLTPVTFTRFTAAYDVHNSIKPQRFFALDHQGRPRFVYFDRNWFVEPDHLGVFYAACDEACADTSNWTHTPIGDAALAADTRLEYPSLTFTRRNQPRVVAYVSVLGAEEKGIAYVGCDTACTTGENWNWAVLHERGSGIDADWDIALDDKDQPRIVFFPGTLEDDRGDQLYYLWCNSLALAGCLDTQQWNATRLRLDPLDGKQPDLVTDADGRPHIAFLSRLGDVGYLWCTAACETDQATWQTRMVETAAMMKQDNPKALPPACDSDLWTALAPALAIAPDGSPRIAYDVSVEARCFYDQGPDKPPVSRIEKVWRGARWVALMSGDAQGGRLFLPLVQR